MRAEPQQPISRKVAPLTVRVAFYLPVVTPWWFDNIVAPLIAVMAKDCEVHVLVPPLSNGTGIEGWQLDRFADCPPIDWHILDGGDHLDLRTSLEGRTM